MSSIVLTPEASMGQSGSAPLVAPVRAAVFLLMASFHNLKVRSEL
jgi:hypothetical protein